MGTTFEEDKRAIGRQRCRGLFDHIHHAHTICVCSACVLQFAAVPGPGGRLLAAAPAHRQPALPGGQRPPSDERPGQRRPAVAPAGARQDRPLVMRVAWFGTLT